MHTAYEAKQSIKVQWKNSWLFRRIMPIDGSPFTMKYFILRLRNSFSVRLKRFLSKQTKYTLQKLSTTCDTKSTRIFEAGSSIVLDKINCFGSLPQNNVLDKTVALNTPKIEITEMENAAVIGKTDFILKDNIAAYPDYIDFLRDVTPMEVHGFATIHEQSSIKFLQPKFKKWRHFNEVISLLGSCTGNYIHWITETLPKLPIIDQCSEYKDYPLLVDKELHANIRESLDVFNVHGRDIITIEQWEMVQAQKIVYITATGYVPFDYRNKDADVVPEIRPDHASFSAPAFHLLNQAVDSIFPQTNSGKLKLFLRRRSPLRRLIQQDDVEQMLEAKGFKAIEPESLTFAEQVDIFRQAEIIVGQAGAALGNMVFAPKGCKIIVLAAYSSFSNFHYFSNLAGILGHQLHYVFGESEVHKGVHPAHGNININVSAINEALA